MSIDARLTAAKYRWPEVTRRLLDHYERLVAGDGQPSRALAVAV
jgi:hypothetical protein